VIWGELEGIGNGFFLFSGIFLSRREKARKLWSGVVWFVGKFLFDFLEGDLRWVSSVPYWVFVDLDLEFLLVLLLGISSSSISNPAMSRSLSFSLYICVYTHTHITCIYILLCVVLYVCVCVYIYWFGIGVIAFVMLCLVGEEKMRKEKEVLTHEPNMLQIELVICQCW
jgi:hypothetical protein